MYSDVEGAFGGIATMWNPSSMTRFELWRDKNVLITEFQTSRESWGLVNIYAPNNKVRRKETYEKLERIMETMKEKQMMCMGDFNTPLYHLEKSGGNRDCPESL